MTTLIHIAAINIDNIIPVIIIFGVIISKIIKAASGMKKNTPGASPADEKEPAYNAAPSELRKFLETLTGVPLDAEKPAPAPPQLPPKQQVRTQQFTQPPKRIKKTTVPAVTTPVTKTTTKKYHPHTKSADFEWQSDARGKNKLVTPLEVANDLISRKNLAKAIILKEILGPPVALK